MVRESNSLQVETPAMVYFKEVYQHLGQADGVYIHGFF